MALGGTMGGTVGDSIFPISMDVDYVRVYQPECGKVNEQPYLDGGGYLGKELTPEDPEAQKRQEIDAAYVTWGEGSSACQSN